MTGIDAALLRSIVDTDAWVDVHGDGTLWGLDDSDYSPGLMVQVWSSSVFLGLTWRGVAMTTTVARNELDVTSAAKALVAAWQAYADAMRRP